MRDTKITLYSNISHSINHDFYERIPLLLSVPNGFVVIDNKKVMIVLTIIVGALILLLTLFWIWKQKRQGQKLKYLNVKEEVT